MSSFLGTIASIILSLSMLGGFVTWSNVAVSRVQAAAAASQLVIVNEAAAQYVKDNSAAIAAQATATVPVSITGQMLINAGNLRGFSPTNVFGQTWLVQVAQPSAGVLQTIVQSVGGRAITDRRQLVQIAAQAGAQGGFVPYAGQNGDASMSPNNAYGAFGAWGPLPLGGVFTNPGSGHLFSLLSFNGANMNNSYLYRVQVPGHPELNNMQTDLGLTDTGGTKHNITGVATATADTLQTTGGGQFNSDQGGSLELGGNNSQAGTGTPYIDFHLAGQGTQDYNTRIVNDSNNHVTIAGANGQGSLGVQGTIQPGNIANPGTPCPKNGAAAANADGSGLWLSCQYGTWLPIGGRWLRYAYYTAQNGSVVPAPTCAAGGIPQILVSGTNFTVNSTATVNFGPSTGVGPWTVHITDGNGSPIPGAMATVGTYCAF